VRLAGIFFYDLDGLQLHHPRTVLQLIARVNCRVIRRLVADHGRDDFEPAHSQAAQRAGVALAFFPVRFVVDARPVAVVAADVHPQVNGGSQETVALVAEIDDGHLARLITDGGHARQTLQSLRYVRQWFQRDEFTQQPGSQLRTGTRQ
jgi:hypothetical protein